MSIALNNFSLNSFQTQEKLDFEGTNRQNCSNHNKTVNTGLGFHSNQEISIHFFENFQQMSRITAPKSSRAIYQAQLVLGTVFNCDFVRNLRKLCKIAQTIRKESLAKVFIDSN